MRTFSKSVVGLFVVAFFLAVASSARADTFNWTYSDTTSATTCAGCTNASGNGTITTGAFSSGQATITGITGTFDGVTIAGLDASGSLGNNDNILYYPAAPYLDLYGFTFHYSNGDQVNLYFYGPTYFAADASEQIFSPNGTFTLSPIAAPEPGTITLLFAGLLGLGLLAGVKRYRGSGLPIEA